jgi:hypothetical protein
MAINRGRTAASCFLNCGVTLGDTPLASFSNSALVITVWQSPAGVFAAGVFAAVCGFDAVALAAAAVGCVEHTPLTVITAAVGGTAAELSAGAWAGRDGEGAPGTACPQASVPNKTHINHLSRINHFLQDWSFRKLKMPSIKS